jgi:hypothetical protein
MNYSQQDFIQLLILKIIQFVIQKVNMIQMFVQKMEIVLKINVIVVLDILELIVN